MFYGTAIEKLCILHLFKDICLEFQVFMKGSYNCDTQHTMKNLDMISLSVLN